MLRSDIKAWSRYLVAQIQEQYGMSRAEAKIRVTDWLRSAIRDEARLRRSQRRPRIAHA